MRSHRQRYRRSRNITARQGVCTTVSVTQAAECTGDNDCPTGEVCDNGSCVPAQTGCTGDNDCPTGQVCENGSCVDDTGNGNGSGSGPSSALLLAGGVGLALYLASRG